MSLFNVFVQNPALIALVAGLFYGAYLLVRSNPGLRSRALLAPAAAWLLWAIWEFVVLVFTPEANIRVDLLLIVPLLLLISLAGIIMLFVRPRLAA